MSLPVYSMTGYATLRIDAAEDTSFTLTLKSVNHRFLDLQLRLPQSCESLEAPIRRLLKEAIQRGHIDFSLQLDRPSRAGFALNHEQIAAYIATFRAAAATHNLATEPDLNEILRLPGMVAKQQPTSAEDTAALEAPVFETKVLSEFPTLLAAFNASRAAEGRILAFELHASMSRIDTLACRSKPSPRRRPRRHLRPPPHPHP